MDFLDRVFALASSQESSSQPPAADDTTGEINEVPPSGPGRPYALLSPHLDGRRTVREVIQAVGPHATADEICTWLKQLAEERHVIDVTDRNVLLRNTVDPVRPPPAGAFDVPAAPPPPVEEPTASVTPLSPPAGKTPVGSQSTPAPTPSSPEDTLTSPQRQATPGARVVMPAPARLGPYRIVQQLGAGGMGVVYEAEDEARHMRVALKVLPKLDPAALYEFKKEFRLVADLAHPNLVSLYELMLDGSTWFFTMELLRGTHLLRYLRESPPVASGQPLAPEQLDRLRATFRQLALGVKALHDHEILHLDLKPSNVLVTGEGHVVLLDFGLAQRVASDEQVPKGLRGTPRYLSPEQALGQPPGKSSDWYTVGVMLFEALTGSVPFDGPVRKSLRARVKGPAPRPSLRCAGIPPELDELCVRLLERDPAQRAGADELLRALSTAPSPIPVSTHAPSALLGRQAELDALMDAYRQARQGALHVSVQGSSGIGKSALVQAFLQRVRSEEHAMVLAGRCHEWESLPFKGFDAVADELCRRIHLLPAEMQQALLDEETHRAAQLFPVLRSLQVLEGIPRPAVGADTPSQQRRKAFLALKRLFGKLCQLGPVVVFIDDVQWGDVDSARLLAELLSPPAAPPVLVLTACRTDEVLRSPFLVELQALQRAQGFTFAQRELAIGPLAPEAAAELTTALLGPDATPARAEAIAREAGGNPLFIEELVQHVPATGDPARADGLPTLDGVVRERLAQLPSAARNVLRVISLAGRLPAQDLAVQAAGVEQDAHGVLAVLRKQALIRTGGPRGSDAVEAYHDRIREGVQAQLTPEEARALHGALARTLEPVAGVEPDVLAHHLHGAGELARAATYAARAADLAYAALAFDRAASRYRQALEWGGEAAAEAPRLEEQLARSLHNAGRGAEAATWYLRVARRKTGYPELELRRLAAEAALTSGQIDEGIAILRPLLAEVGLSYPSQTCAAFIVLARLGWLFLRGLDFEPEPPDWLPREKFFPGDLCWTAGKGLGSEYPAQGMAFFLRSLAAAVHLRDASRVGRMVSMLGSTLIGMGGGNVARGERYLARAEALAQKSGDAYLQALVDIHRGVGELAGAGDWDVAQRRAEAGVRVLQERFPGTSWECAIGLTVVSRALENRGELREMVERVNVWMREAIERGDLYEQNVLSHAIAYGRIATQDTAGARDLMRDYMRRWASRGYTVQHFYALHIEVLCDLYEGRPDEGWSRFSAQRRDMERAFLLKITISRIEILCQEAGLRLALAARGGAEAAGHLEACEKIARRLERERRSDGAPHASWIRALSAAIEGKRDRAVALLDEGTERFTRAGMGLYARYLTRRKGELTGDTALVAQCDAWMQGQGIRDPARWTRCWLPELPAAGT